MKADDNGLSIYVSECKRKILEPLHEVYGIDISEEALRKAVENHNKVCDLISQIGEFRKEENPRITGYEYHMITLASYVCPKDMLVEKLEETLEELKTREPVRGARRRTVNVPGSSNRTSGTRLQTLPTHTLPSSFAARTSSLLASSSNFSKKYKCFKSFIPFPLRF